MSGNSFGNLFRITTFGESHGEALGVVIDGCPSLLDFDLSFIQSEMDRRRPGSTSLGTKRNEGDKIEVLSGVFEGKTTGAPICMMIRNSNQISKDYSDIKDLFRPSHADYTYFEKWGIRDYRGGGRSSGRETSARVAAGAVAKLFLKQYGINISAGTVQIGTIKASVNSWNPPFNNEISTPDEEAYPAMAQLIKKAFNEQNSIGGIIECHISGVPVGLGEPCFDKLDAALAQATLSIGACKGFEIGSGFKAASMFGSENNDPIYTDEDKNVHFKSNNAGGILGGISNGDEIIFRAAFKPTASIARVQETIDKDKNNVSIIIKGRHDPCIVPRAVVVVEAMSALVIADYLLRMRAYG